MIYFGGFSNIVVIKSLDLASSSELCLSGNVVVGFSSAFTVKKKEI